MDAYAELLRGAYDLHIHTGPDICERKVDDLDMAERIERLGMKGFGIKSHYFCTAERARLVKKLYPNVNPIGSISLNNTVGGINPTAVEMAAKDGAKIVWMPTIDAQNELDYMLNQESYEEPPPWVQVQLDLKKAGKKLTGISILKDGHLLDSVKEVINICKQYDLILGTGHLGKKEIYELVKAAQQNGLKKIVVTHPTFSSVGLSKEEQKELTELGALMEQCFGVITPTLGTNWDSIYQIILYVGSQNCILSSDLGQIHNPYPDEGMTTFVKNLITNGFSKEDISKMTVENTGFLVEG